MKHTKEKHIIWIPILLILSFLIFPLMHQKKEKNKGQKTAAKTEQTGFLDYDLLPEELKQEMEKLQKHSPSFPLYFIYFFENDDINHRYYITVTFSFNKQDQEVLLSMSDVQEADKNW